MRLCTFPTSPASPIPDGTKPIANGFYWRIATSAAIPNVVEVRRAEGGIRAWAAEPGEY